MDLTLSQVATQFDISTDKVLELVSLDEKFFSQWVTKIDDISYFHKRAVDKIETLLSGNDAVKNDKTETKIAKKDTEVADTIKTQKKVSSVPTEPVLDIKPTNIPVKEEKPRKRKSKLNVPKDFFNSPANIDDTKAVRTFLIGSNTASLNDVALMSDKEVSEIFNQKYIELKYQDTPIIISKEALIGILPDIFSV